MIEGKKHSNSQVRDLLLLMQSLKIPLEPTALTPELEEILKQQTIAKDQPATVVRDFQTFLKVRFPIGRGMFVSIPDGQVCVAFKF